MSEKAKAPGSEMFDQAIKNYEQTLRAGLKLQEETARWWTNVLSQASSVQDWQDRVKSATDEVINPTQKRIEEYLGLIERSNRASLDLVKKAMEAGRSSNPSEVQAKVMEFCEASLGILKSNAQAVAEINTKMVESWVNFVKKNAVEFTPAVGKA